MEQRPPKELKVLPDTEEQFKILTEDITILDRLSRDERRRLAEEYKNRFLEISPETRRAALERFLAHESLNEDEVLTILQEIDRVEYSENSKFERGTEALMTDEEIEKMDYPAESRGVILEYLGRFLDPTRYPKVIQGSWRRMSYTARDFIIAKIIREKPEAAHILFPLVNLDDFIFNEPLVKPEEKPAIGNKAAKDNSREENKTKTAVRSSQKTINQDKNRPKYLSRPGFYPIDWSRFGKINKSNQTLLAVVSELSESTPFDRMRDLRPRRLVNRSQSERRRSLMDDYFGSEGCFEAAKAMMEQCLELPNWESANAVITYYLRKNPYFLFPYLPRLVEKGILTEEQAQWIFTAKKSGTYDSYMPTDFYQTEKEREEIRRLTARGRVLNPRQERQEEVKSVFQWQEYPIVLRRTIDVISDRASRRGLNHALSNLKECGRYLASENRMKFLEDLSNLNLPILEELKNFNFTKSELRTLLNRLYEGGNIDLTTEDLPTIHFLIESGFEDFVFQLITENITSGNDEVFGPHLVREFPEALALFTKKHQEQLIETISDNIPVFWILNPDLFSCFQPMAYQDLLARLVADRPYGFISSFHQILFQNRALQKSQPNQAMEESEIYALAKTIFSASSDFCFIYPRIFYTVFGKSDAGRFIKERIMSGDPGFIKKILQKAIRNSEGEIRSEAEYFWQEFLPTVKQQLTSQPERLVDLVNDDPAKAWPLLNEIFLKTETWQTLFSNRDRVDLGEIFEKYGDQIFLELIKHPNHLERFSKYLNTTDDHSLLAWSSKSLGNIIRASDPRSYKRLEGEELLEISARDRLSFINIEEKLSKIVLAAARKNQFLVFSDSFMSLNHSALREFRNRDIVEFSRLYPERAMIFGLRLSTAEYETAVLGNPRAAAFLLSRYGNPLLNLGGLGPDTLEKIQNLNPLMRISQKGKLDEDYYAKAIKILELRPFFELYRKRLLEIRDQKNNDLGPLMDLDNIKPDEEFYRLANTILLLENIPAVAHDPKGFLAMPTRIRESILEHLQILAFRNLDHDLRLDFSEHPKILEKTIILKLTRYIRSVFEIPEDQAVNLGVTEISGLFSLVTYYMGSCQDNKEMRQAVRSLVQKVVSGRYDFYRAWGEGVPETLDRKKSLRDLKNSGLLPEELNDVQYEAFLKDESLPFEETLSLELEDVRLFVKSTLEQAAADGHIPKNGQGPTEIQQSYAEMIHPIQELSEELAALQKNFETAKKAGQKTDAEESRRYKEIQKLIVEYRETNKEALNEAEARLIIFQLQNITAIELEQKILTISRKKIPLARAFEIIVTAFQEKNPNFVQDIQRISEALYAARQHLFGGERVSKSKLTISDAVDFATYVQVGEVPVPSCQSYNSDRSRYNFGLLSYIIDPNAKIIQVRNESGQLIARSILRVLSDPAGSPQLFLERVYSTNAHPKITESVIAFAKKKANQMDVGLWAHLSEGYRPYVSSSTGFANLTSRGSRAPYVYTDSGGGRIRNGKYTIQGAVKIS